MYLKANYKRKQSYILNIINNDFPLSEYWRKASARSLKLPTTFDFKRNQSVLTTYPCDSFSSFSISLNLGARFKNVTWKAREKLCPSNFTHLLKGTCWIFKSLTDGFADKKLVIPWDLCHAFTDALSNFNATQQQISINDTIYLFQIISWKSKANPPEKDFQSSHTPFQSAHSNEAQKYKRAVVNLPKNDVTNGA